MSPACADKLGDSHTLFPSNNSPHNTSRGWAFALHIALVQGPLCLLTVNQLYSSNDASANKTFEVMRLFLCCHTSTHKRWYQSLKSGLPVMPSSPAHSALERQVMKTVLGLCNLARPLAESLNCLVDLALEAGKFADSVKQAQEQQALVSVGRLHLSSVVCSFYFAPHSQIHKSVRMGAFHQTSQASSSHLNQWSRTVPAQP